MTQQHLISDNKLQHIRAVAQLMYDTTLALGHDKNLAEQMYLLGFVHDIGYIRQPENHSAIGAELLHKENYKHYSEVAKHGRFANMPTFALKLLWYCDLHVDHKGNVCTFKERLTGIEQRYGLKSTQYQNAQEIIQYLKRCCPYLMRIKI